jgi:hypothetical protein
MKTQEFVKQLQENPTAALQFEIEEGIFIEPTYHITEIKNAKIESVDCGGNPDSYNHTIVQLWINPEEKLRKPWTAKKALNIIELVDKVTPIDGQAELFFEYGDLDTRTSHYSINALMIEKQTLKVQLYTKATVCKPSLATTGASTCC